MGLDAGSWWLVAPEPGRQSEADAQCQVGSETFLSVYEIILSCWVSTLSCLELSQENKSLGGFYNR